jgi:hypothetical protein
MPSRRSWSPPHQNAVRPRPLPDRSGERVVGVKLGVAVCGQDQESKRTSLCDDVSQQNERGAVSPLQVVEQQHHGGRCAGGLEQPDDRVEHQVALRLRVRLIRRWRIGEPAPERGNHARELRAVAVAVVLEQVEGRVLDNG